MKNNQSAEGKQLPNGRGMLYLVWPRRRTLQDAIDDFNDAAEQIDIARCATPPTWIDMIGGW